jgi:hypothetical protein
MSELTIDPGTVYELVVAPQTPTLVELATPGPQGPPGPAGPAGGATYLYDRAGVPAATWTIVHGLGRRVHVTIAGDDGREVDSDVQHVDSNTIVITFAEPFSGTALIG